MHTTLTLMQTAGVLGMAMQDVARLIRKKQIKVHHKDGKVKHIATEEIQAYVNRIRLQEI